MVNRSRNLLFSITHSCLMETRKPFFVPVRLYDLQSERPLEALNGVSAGTCPQNIVPGQKMQSEP
jgi:hypothetical protein